jgi:hypothetical protein
MAEHGHPANRTGGDYERSDALFGPTFRAGLAILGAMFLTAAIVVPIYRLLARDETRTQPAAATALPEEARRESAEAAAAGSPRLVTSEPAALAAFRAQEDAFLTSYGWVEKDRGLVRIPIDEALRIVAAKGELPAFPAAPAPATPGTTGARP